jgi:hypothetical protein
MDDDCSDSDRRCHVCGRPMTLLATLPQVGLMPAKRVFLCEPCGVAISDEPPATEH